MTRDGEAGDLGGRVRAGEARSGNRSARATTTLLIVDDDPELRDYMERTLRREPRVGHVLQAEDGERAWALVRSGRVQVVVTDVVLPHLDGFALCARLDADPELRSIPVLLVTGDAAYRQGAHEYASRAARRAVLLKPFNAGALLAAVRGLMDAMSFREG